MSCKKRVLLRRGVLSPATGSGCQAAPAAAATITLWDANANVAVPWPAVSAFERIALNIYSSHVSATNGVIIETSGDGTNWRTYATYTLPATTNQTYDIPVTQPFMRIRYTNSDNTLTAWEMSVMGIKQRAMAV